MKHLRSPLACFVLGLLIVAGECSAKEPEKAKTPSGNVAGKPNPQRAHGKTAAVSESGPPPSPEPSNSKISDAEFESNLERAGEIAKEPVERIFQKYLNAGRVEHNEHLQYLLVDALAGGLKRGPVTAEFLQRIREFLQDPKNDEHERTSVVYAFGRAQTKVSVEFLVELATNKDADASIRDTAITQFVLIGRRNPEPYIATLLEALWRESKDEELLSAVAYGMAHNGATSSIELLVASLVAQDGLDDVRRNIAAEALPDLNNADDEGLKRMADVLKSSPIDSKASLAAFVTLRGVTDNHGRIEIIKWFPSAPGNAMDYFEGWAQAPDLYFEECDAAEKVLAANKEFKSKAIRSALQKWVKDFRKRNGKSPKTNEEQ